MISIQKKVGLFICFLFSVGFISLIPVSTYAFVRTASCSQVSPPICEPGQEPVPLHWQSRCALYHINEDLLGINNDDLVYDAIKTSYTTWDQVDCSYFELIYGGQTNEDRVGYIQTEGNANIVVFRKDEWNDRSDIIALTSVTHDKYSGVIYDADIEMNGVHFIFTVTDNRFAVRADVQNTLTHEIGHFIGLDHSFDMEATMYSAAGLGELSKRSLKSDDEAGLCTIYPISKAADAKPCNRSNLGYFTKGQGKIDDGCCHTAPSAPSTRSGLLLFVVGFMLVLIRIRREGS